MVRLAVHNAAKLKIHRARRAGVMRGAKQLLRLKYFPSNLNPVRKRCVHKIGDINLLRMHDTPPKIRTYDTLHLAPSA
jgi:hypothetical protein